MPEEKLDPRAGEIFDDVIGSRREREIPLQVALYECPCCMTDLRGSARACPTCKINLPRDWLDARLWSMFGVTKEVEAKLVEYRCPLCDQPTGADYECGDCGGIPATPRLRGVEDGKD